MRCTSAHKQILKTLVGQNVGECPHACHRSAQRATLIIAHSGSPQLLMHDACSDVKYMYSFI